MSNENNESKKMILGVMAGALVGAVALYWIHQTRRHQTPILHKVGRTLIDVGEALEKSHLETFSDVADEVQKSFPKSADFMSNVCHWLSSGIQLWQKKQNGG